MPPSVLVLGSGIIGSAIAYELTAAGAEVTVLDARGVGQGATRASAGVLAPFIEGHEATPLREMGETSLGMFDAFIARVEAACGDRVIYQRCGTFEVAITDEDVDRLSAASARLWKAGIEARWVPTLAFDDHEPLATPEAEGALLIPQHGFVGVTSLTCGCADAARRAGASFHVNTAAITVASNPGGGVVVSTDSRRWTVDHVVMAAGSWSSRITVEGADEVPVRPIRGQLLQMMLPEGALRHVVWSRAGYIVPWPDGTVLVGATVEDVGFDEEATEAGFAQLQAAAATMVPVLASAQVMDVRVGLRPRGPDELPLVGPSTVVPGLLYATAHYRNGVLLAPLTAAMVRDTLVPGRAPRGAAPVPLDPRLAPSRAGRL
jgi:glycine oxidase